jgi:hypothetical protein
VKPSLLCKQEPEDSQSSKRRYETGNHVQKQIVVLKAPLAKLLRDPQHLTVCRDSIKTINRVVTAAYLLARFIFIHSYEDDNNFNADTYITTKFFDALQKRTRKNSKREEAIQNRELINRYIDQPPMDAGNGHFEELVN